MKKRGILVVILITLIQLCNAQKLDQTFCNLHLGCTSAEAKEVMAGTKLIKEQDGYQDGTRKLIYEGNIHHAGAGRTTLTFFTGKLMDVHIDYAPPYDSFEVFQEYKAKLEKKFGKMKKSDSKTLKYDYEVVSGGMKIQWLWTENQKGAKFISATHMALHEQALAEWMRELKKRQSASDGLGEF